MVEKMQYGYQMTLPMLDKYAQEMAYQAAPDLFPNRDKAVDKPGGIDVKLTGIYSTNGWDTVSVCSVTDLNKSVAAQKTYPMSMKHTIKDEDGGDISLSADFDPWSISANGDGGLVNLKIPIKSGSLIFDGNELNIKDSSAVIQVRLSFYPLIKGSVAEPSNYNLDISKSTNNRCVISVVEFNTNLGRIKSAIAQSVFSDWLNLGSTLEKIGILFATAQLNMSDSENFKWLTPTYSSYAYVDVGGDLSKSKFAVLCMLMNRKPPEVHQAPGIIYSEGCNYAFMINREVYVEYQLLPSMTYTFEGSKPSDFSLGSSEKGESKSTITAHNLKLEKVEYASFDYYPVMDNMSIEVNEDKIICTVDFTTEISPGITAHSFVKTENLLKLDKNDAGEIIMIYDPIGEPITRNQTDVSPGIIVTEVLVEIITAVVGFGVGKVVSTIIKRVVCAVIVVLVCVTISVIIHVIIEKIYSEGVQKQMPSIMPMTATATKYVKWPFLKDAHFVPKEVVLNGTLCFMGVLE